jgi:RimJ/RimL family protein N-acetyltransferase
MNETKDFLRRTKEAWSNAKEYTWAIVLKESSNLIGMIALRITLPRAEFGYVIAKPYWNKGYTTEAARLIVDWAINQKQIYRVWSLVDVDNTASARVLEKAGLEREGILRRWMYHSASDEPRDCICYAKVK